MRLLKLSRLSRVALFAIAVLSITYFAFSIYDLMRQPWWTFDSTQAELTQKRLVGLTTDQQRSTHWNNLLEDRSKAWTNMESLSRMFPENAGMLVKSYTYVAKPESNLTKASKPEKSLTKASKPESKPSTAKVGLVKEWKITGYARDEALDYLNTLNTREGISAHFSEIARITGNTAFSPTGGNRSLVVNVSTQENSSYKNIPPEETQNTDESSYPFTFDLTITQRFEATDPMAINVVKAP